MTAVYARAVPYLDDARNLPVADAAGAAPFYESVMGFRVLSRDDAPPKRVLLGRDAVEIGLVENGGDPSQAGCFFEVDNVEAAFAELQANGLGQADANYRIDNFGADSFKVFFVVAPDGLCYCLGERQA